MSEERDTVEQNVRSGMYKSKGVSIATLGTTYNERQYAISSSTISIWIWAKKLLAESAFAAVKKVANSVAGKRHHTRSRIESRKSLEWSRVGVGGMVGV